MRYFASFDFIFRMKPKHRFSNVPGCCSKLVGLQSVQMGIVSLPRGYQATGTADFVSSVYTQVPSRRRLFLWLSHSFHSDACTLISSISSFRILKDRLDSSTTASLERARFLAFSE
jgi:hypothetical protein